MLIKNFYKVNKKIKSEIEEIEKHVYNLSSKDGQQVFYNLSFKHDNVIRGYVLFLHLSFEDLIDQEISRAIYTSGRKKMRGRVSRDFRKSKLYKKISYEIHNSKFLVKLSLAKYLHILTSGEVGKLVILNKIRNQSSHNWFPDSYVYKKYPRENRGKLRPLVEYQGKNLFDKEVFLDIFLPIYGPLYFKIFSRIYKL